MPRPKGLPKTGGRQTGVQNHDTAQKKLDAEARLMALRDLVSRELEGMVQAQVEHAKGVSYMVLRNSDGTFTRATDEKQIDAACAVGASAFRIFTQAPNTSAFADLLNRTFGKPAERIEMTGRDGEPLEFKWAEK